jgi:hypothetical protein
MTTFSGSYAPTRHDAPIMNEHGVQAELIRNGLHVCHRHQDVLLRQRNVIGGWKTLLGSCSNCDYERRNTQGPPAPEIDTVTVSPIDENVSKIRIMHSKSEVLASLKDLAQLALVLINKVKIAEKGGITMILYAMTNHLSNADV